MKLLLAILAAALASVALAAESIQVYLDPTEDAVKIGELEAISLAVPAQWPRGTVAREGWQPIYYRGIFEVYVDNNDIGKDLSTKPGSPYLTAPDKKASTIALATDKDKTDILSVGTWFCKMRLETIIVGYIASSSIDPSQIVTSLPATALDKRSAGSGATAITELVGRFVKTGLIGQKRTGLSYRIEGIDGKTLAFVDISEVPERIQVDEFLKLEVRVSGFLTQNEDNSDIVVKAKTIKKAF